MVEIQEQQKSSRNLGAHGPEHVPLLLQRSWFSNINSYYVFAVILLVFPQTFLFVVVTLVTFK